MKSPNLSGKNEADFNNQFSLPSKYYNDNVDIVSWLPYFWCFKEINRVSPNSILCRVLGVEKLSTVIQIPCILSQRVTLVFNYFSSIAEFPIQ